MTNFSLENKMFLLQRHKGFLGCLHNYEENGLSDFQTFPIGMPLARTLFITYVK